VSVRHKLVGNAAVYLGANVLNAAIPFLLLPVLTRVLSPADYGTLAMFSIAVSILGAFTGLSVHGAIGVRYFTLERAALADYVGACVTILALSTLTLVALVAALGAPLAAVSGVPADWLLVAVVLSGLQVLGNIRLSLWQVAGQARRFGSFQVGQSLLNAGLSLLFILALGMGWQGRVSGQAFALGTFGALAVWLLRVDGLVRLGRAARAHAGDALRFGVPLIPHVLGALMLATSGQFFVTNMIGLNETGIYVVAAQVGAVVGLIADAFVKSYSPWLYERLKDETPAGKQLIVGATYAIMLGFLLLSAAACAVVYWLFPYVVGERFMAARGLSFFFIFGNGFTGMYLAVAGFFFFTSKTKYVSVVSLSAGLLALAAMWLGARAWGLQGIAAAFLFSQVAMLALAWAGANLVYPMPWLQFGPAIAALRRV